MLFRSHHERVQGAGRTVCQLTAPRREHGVVRQRLVQVIVITLTRNLECAELTQVIGDELRVEQAEAAEQEMRGNGRRKPKRSR